MGDVFHKLAKGAANAVGSPKSFIVAVVVLVLWAVSGPLFHFSDTWQLIINTGTTIVTFLIFFIIKKTHNPFSWAIHHTLAARLRAPGRPRNRMVDLESLSDEELAKLQAEFQRLHQKACEDDR